MLSEFIFVTKKKGSLLYILLYFASLSPRIHFILVYSNLPHLFLQLIAPPFIQPFSHVWAWETWETKYCLVYNILSSYVTLQWITEWIYTAIGVSPGQIPRRGKTGWNGKCRYHSVIIKYSVLGLYHFALPPVMYESELFPIASRTDYLLSRFWFLFLFLTIWWARNGILVQF